MFRTLLLAGAALGVTLTPAVAAPGKTSSSSAATLPASNPFAKPSTLPFQAPDFSKIKDSDYLQLAWIIVGGSHQRDHIG